MIARRTCHEEQMDLELKQLHCHMEEEVCDKNNMKPSKREWYFVRGEKAATGNYHCQTMAPMRFLVVSGDCVDNVCGVGREPSRFELRSSAVQIQKERTGWLALARQPDVG